MQCLGTRVCIQYCVRRDYRGRAVISCFVAGGAPPSRGSIVKNSTKWQVRAHAMLVLSLLVHGVAALPAASEPWAAAGASPWAAASEYPAAAAVRSPQQPAAFSAAFVGNSYTFYSDLPAMIASVAASTAAAELAPVASNLPGGSALWEHADEARYGVETGAMLLEAAPPGGWDFVVLQDQSQSAGGGAVSSGTPLPAGECKARALASLAAWFRPRLNGATPVFYSSWGRRDGDPFNAEIFPDFLSMNRLTTAGMF